MPPSISQPYALVADLQFELSSFDQHMQPAHASGSAADEDDETKFVDAGADVEDPLVSGIVIENQTKSNIYMAFMNMANSILGAGIIGQPFAINNCGLVGGVAAIVLLTLLVDWTIRLIVVNLKLTGKTTYQDSVEFAMGRRGKLLILAANGLFAFGGCIGFCIIIGDTIPHVLRAFFPAHTALFHRNAIIFFVTLFVSYPLSLNRDISKLSKASMLALASMLLIVVIVIVKGPMLDAAYKGSLTASKLFITPRIFQGISVISFALVCHHNTSFIYFSLKNPSLKRFNKLTHLSCLVSMVVCFVMGYSGFLVFKDKTKGNILNNFPSDDNVINVARFCFGFNMLTTFPLEIFVLRDVVRDLAHFHSGEATAPAELSTKKHVAVTSALVFLTMAVSLTTCNLGALFELIGATTASMMAYILPPLTNLLLTGRAKTLRQKLPYYGCIVFGFAVMVISSTQTILAAINGGEQKHCET